MKVYGRLDNNKQLTNKKGLFINMREYYNVIGVDPFSVLPLTFNVRGVNDSEFAKFEQEFRRTDIAMKQRRKNLEKELTDFLK